MRLQQLLYGTYERRLLRGLRSSGQVPRHIGVILDGNRRWARQLGHPDSHGHQRGADKITEMLQWSDEIGVEVVTLWMLSTDNLANRDPGELGELFDIIIAAVGRLARDGRWRLQLVGSLGLLPPEVSRRLQEAAAPAAAPAAGGMHVNIAVGYGGRHEIADAVREFLEHSVSQGLSLAEAAERFSVEHIAQHLYTKGQPDPDLVIRTSGEQRLSGFLMWQSAHSEFYFCEAYWPDFRHVDFLRALRAYSQRERRRGR
jgi:short-chain Z-isoprenyl diphosphate synthase